MFLVIGKMTASDVEIVSFVYDGDTNVDVMRFVIETSGIKKVEEISNNEEVDESSSFIDKLLSLFGIK